MWCVPSATRNRNGISNRDAYNIGGGDGFHADVDPRDPNTIYIDSQEGRSSRVNLATLERQVIAPAPVEKPKPGERERWSWDTPIVLSSFDPSVVYTGSNVLFRSADGGATWKAISPDLTANVDRDTLKMMGALVPKDALSRHDGQAAYGTLTAIAESPLDAKVLYTGSDDGQLQVTRDLGADVDQSHVEAAGPAAQHVRQQRPRLASRGRARVRDVRRPLQRRLQAVRLRQRGLRPDVAVDRGRAARDRGAPDPRASAQRAAALRRTRARDRRVDRRRRLVDLARHEHAARAGGRHRDSPARQRARRRHARPRPLGARRHRAARAPDRRRDQERRVAAADSAGAAAEHLRPSGLVRRRPVLRAQSHLRRGHHVLSARGAQGGRAGGHRRAGRPAAAHASFARRARG